MSGSVVPQLDGERLGAVQDAVVRKVGVARAVAATLKKVGLDSGGEVCGVDLSLYSRTVYTPEMCEALADDLVEWVLGSEDHRCWTSWCVDRGIGTGMLGVLQDRSGRFRLAYEYAKMVWMNRLIEGGLAGKLNGRLSKFLLQGMCDLKERHVVEGVVGGGGMPGSVEEVDAAMSALAAHRASLVGMVEEARQLGSVVVGDVG